MMTIRDKVVYAIAVLGIIVSCAFWVSEYRRCNAQRGVLLRNAMGLPTCVAATVVK